MTVAVFVAEGANLRTTLECFAWELRDGFTYDMDMPGGEEEGLEFPKSMTDGQEITFTGLGRAKQDGSGKGDLIVDIKFVEAPTYDIYISLEDLVNGIDTTTFVIDDDGDEIEIDVEFEAGFRPGDELEIQSEDCYVRLVVEDHAGFSIEGNDLCTILEIDEAQAQFGCRLPIDLPDGSDVLIVNPGTKDGDEVVYEGLGLPQGDEEAPLGDLQVTFEVKPVGLVSTLIRALARTIG